MYMKLKQLLHSDHFTISYTVQTRVIHPWLSTLGMNLRYTTSVIGIAKDSISVLACDAKRSCIIESYGWERDEFTEAL